MGDLVRVVLIFLLSGCMIVLLVMLAWLIHEGRRDGLLSGGRYARRSPSEPDGHVHSWVVTHVRGCAHSEPGPYCRQCGERVEQTGLSCSGCALPVITMDGGPVRYESDEEAMRDIRHVGLDLQCMSDEELISALRDMVAE